MAGLAGVLVAASCSASRTTPGIRLAPPPVPQFMVSGVAGWEDAAITSLCVEVAADGEFSGTSAGGPFRGTPEDLVAMVVAGFGVPIVADGCDARLSVEVSARLIPETGAGTCYRGSEGRVTATLSMPGRPDATGVHGHRRETPVEDCSTGPAVGPDIWTAMLAGDGSVLDGNPGALVDLFGDPVWLAINLAGREATDTRRAALDIERLPALAEGGNGGMLATAVGSPPDPEAVAVVLRRLAGDDRAGRYLAARVTHELARGGDPTTRETMQPLVPHLIRALALEDAWEVAEYGEMHSGEDDADLPAMRGVLGGALQALTGADLDFRADLWWRWLRGRGQGGTAHRPFVLEVAPGA